MRITTANIIKFFIQKALEVRKITVEGQTYIAFISTVPEEIQRQFTEEDRPYYVVYAYIATEECFILSWTETVILTSLGKTIDECFSKFENKSHVTTQYYSPAQLTVEESMSIQSLLSKRLGENYDLCA